MFIYKNKNSISNIVNELKLSLRQSTPVHPGGE